MNRAAIFIDTARRYPLARYHFFIPIIVAVFIVAPVAYMALDRTPPLILYEGELDPSVVRPGQNDVRVRWRATFAGRDCPGLSQRELIDSQSNLWPRMARGRRGTFVPDRGDPLHGHVETPPLSIPPQITPGRAYYQVTQFYYCNPLQRWLDWPIVQRSPPLPFEVVP